MSEKETMSTYEVKYGHTDWPDLPLVFYCDARSPTHAIEQAEKALPDCVIKDVSLSRPNRDEFLQPYVVTFFEAPDYKYELLFTCMAEDEIHAREQAENAYPACTVTDVILDKFANYVLYSPSEAENDVMGDGGFWNNEQGWGDLRDATLFRYSETQSVIPPITGQGDAVWLDRHWPGLPIVQKSPALLQDFLRKVGVCINSMAQNDAVGGVYVFQRRRGDLEKQKVLADNLIARLMQYEMIVFDGGNTHGDCWKHLFFPQQLESVFIDESALVGNPTTMEVSLNGGVTWQPAPEGVRIAYRAVSVSDEHDNLEVHLNATAEGLITDVWSEKNDGREMLSIGTSSALIEDIARNLMNP